MKKVLLLSLQIGWDMGYCFQIKGMTRDKPEKNKMKKVMTANDRKIQFATMVEEKFTLAWPTARNCGDRSKLCAKLAQQLGGHVVGHVVKIMHKQ